ncbi:MAG: histidine kinase [Desulfosporosinus sp.]|nr:histidine kinase [Desulfosporosinus sp.]
MLKENVNNERQKRLLELDFLRAQINPHFIYNTLSSIRFYVEMGKNKEAEEMLYHFSKLLRRVLSRGVNSY